MTTTEAENKAFVLEAFDTLFNKRDYAAAERFWSPAYIQHSAHIAPGREGLFELVKTAPKELHYENALIVADGAYVMLHGRFSGIGQPVNWVVVDILRIENGKLAEHWDVIQDEATREVFEERAANVRRQISRLTAALQRASDRSVAKTSGSADNKLKGDINMRAVQLTAFGNPVEGLEYVDIPEPDAPGPNQVLIGVEFSPINPNDLLLVQGIYAFRPVLPTVIGNEGVGRVLAVGPGVENVKVGDRVLPPLSSFTWRERMVISAGGLFALPADADPQQLAMLAINPRPRRCCSASMSP